MDDPMPAADAPAYEAEDYDDADEDEEDEGEEEETGAGSGKRGARGDDDEYDLRQFGIYQALPVEGEPDWSTDVIDAEEYIRRVRHEAAQCPRVVRADIDVEALAKQQQQSEEPGAGGAAGAEQQQQQAGSKQRRPRAHHPLSAAGGPLLQERAAQLPEAPGWMLPCSGWVQQFVSDFQQLRRQVADAYETGELASEKPLPGPNDLQGWDRLCFGRGDGDEAAAAAAASGSGEGDGGAAAAVPGSEITFLSPAILPTLMALDQVGVEALFMHHAQQLLDLAPPALPLARAQWLFALAARLEKPLHSDAAACFRGVLRRCAELRAAVGDAGDPLLPRLNVLIAVAGAYFGQDEGMVQIVDAIELF